MPDMPDMPEFAENTLDAAYVLYGDMMDNEDFAADMEQIAEGDPNFPMGAVRDEGDESDIEFVSALTALTAAKWTFDTNPIIRDLILNVRDYIEMHNAPDGYMNDIVEEINPYLVKLDITPVTIVFGDD